MRAYENPITTNVNANLGKRYACQKKLKSTYNKAQPAKFPAPHEGKCV